MQRSIEPPKFDAGSGKCVPFSQRRIPAAPRTPEMIQRDHQLELRAQSRHVRLSTHTCVLARRFTGSAPPQCIAWPVNYAPLLCVTLYPPAYRGRHHYHYHYYARGPSLSPPPPLPRGIIEHSAVSALFFYIKSCAGFSLFSFLQIRSQCGRTLLHTPFRSPAI